MNIQTFIWKPQQKLLNVKKQQKPPKHLVQPYFLVNFTAK